MKRYPVMYNDFILVGPKSDSARAKGRDIVAGLTRIKAKGASFISRGDRSDTHAAELNLWKIAKVDITQQKKKSPWYNQIGQGMGPALNTAAASNSYVLADRGVRIEDRQVEVVTAKLNGVEHVQRRARENDGGVGSENTDG